MPSTTLYHRTVRGAIKQWSCRIEDDGITVTTEWGLQDGKLQTTSDTMTSRGREGTAAFKTPQVVAQEEFSRLVEGKLRCGYVARPSRVIEQVEVDNTLDFDDLPRSFAPAKPIRTVDVDEALEWDAAHLLSIQRKRDGMRHYIVSGSDRQHRVYSRGMDDMTAHFETVLAGLDLPEGTVLDCEFVVQRPDNRDDFKAVSTICRSLPDKAHREIESYIKQGCLVRFLAFDLLYLNRQPIFRRPYAERYEALSTVVDSLRSAALDGYDPAVRLMPELTAPLPEAIKRVHRFGWEGLVLWRKDQATVVQMNRNPKRTNCYKLKPVLEDDFVATGFDYGTGKNQRRVGALNLAQYNERGALVSLGNVASGLSDQQREEALHWKYPCVVQVKFDERSDTGLRAPRFMRKRSDKKPKECVIP